MRETSFTCCFVDDLPFSFFSKLFFSAVKGSAFTPCRIILIFTILCITVSQNPSAARTLNKRSHHHFIPEITVNGSYYTGQNLSNWPACQARHHTISLGIRYKGQKTVLKVSYAKVPLGPNYEIVKVSNGTRSLPDSFSKGRCSVQCMYTAESKHRGGEVSYIKVCGQELMGTVFIRGRPFLIGPRPGTTNHQHSLSMVTQPMKEGLVQPTMNWKCGQSEAILPEYGPHPFNSSAEWKARKVKRAASDQLYLELYIVADNWYYNRHGSSVENVESRVVTNLLYVNQRFHSLGVSIILVKLEIWTGSSEIGLEDISAHHVASDVIEKFGKYQTANVTEHRDSTQLLTAVLFERDQAGLAWIGTICTADYSVSVVSERFKEAQLSASIMAHEIGHILGLNHDGGHCACSGSEICLMSPRLNSPQDNWSNCSIKELEAGINNLHSGICLQNIPGGSIKSQRAACGNHIVETGESCDCGPPDACDNPCCDASTCQLQPTALCATGGCCDLSECSIRPLAYICRAADDFCDIPEVCDGNNFHCPVNRHKIDGTPCTGGRCHGGLCGTRERQCKFLWGSDATDASLACYEHNTRAREYGFCNFSVPPGSRVPTFRRCPRKDVLCGQVKCADRQGFPLGLPLGFNAYELRNGFYKVYTTSVQYCSYTVLHLDPKYSMVPNGAHCGDGTSYCVNNQCVPVPNIDLSVCRGRGDLDNTGKCSCKPGYTPPYCVKELPAWISPSLYPESFTGTTSLTTASVPATPLPLTTRPSSPTTASVPATLASLTTRPSGPTTASVPATPASLTTRPSGPTTAPVPATPASLTTRPSSPTTASVPATPASLTTRPSGPTTASVPATPASLTTRPSGRTTASVPATPASLTNTLSGPTTASVPATPASLTTRPSGRTKTSDSVTNASVTASVISLSDLPMNSTWPQRITDGSTTESPFISVSSEAGTPGSTGKTGFSANPNSTSSSSPPEENEFQFNTAEFAESPILIAIGGFFVLSAVTYFVSKILRRRSQRNEQLRGSSSTGSAKGGNPYSMHLTDSYAYSGGGSLGSSDAHQAEDGNPPRHRPKHSPEKKSKRQKQAPVPSSSPFSDMPAPVEDVLGVLAGNQAATPIGGELIDSSLPATVESLTGKGSLSQHANTSAVVGTSYAKLAAALSKFTANRKRKIKRSKRK